MWLIVGLNNPGSQYARTRHNFGLWVMDAAATALKAKRLKPGYESLLTDDALAFQRACGLRLTRIGIVEPGNGVQFFLRGQPRTLKGFDHFG